MRFHIITKRETSNGSRHAEFDCTLGRVHRGLERLEEWQELFPEDPNLLFREAHIRSEYLGQGRRAGALYQRAYEAHPGMMTAGLSVAFTRPSAAGNAAMFASTLEDYESWARRAGGTAQVKVADDLAKAVTQGQSFGQIQQALAVSRESEGHTGDAASLLEIALAVGGIALEEEIFLRRLRAQLLRKLDAQAEAARNARFEDYPGPERLSLIEALDEIERALSLDEFDAEMWNLKSAWLILLDRFAEGLECAEKASSLRPGAYSKPLVNKAQALRGLGRFEEAEACARKSIESAKASGDTQDAAMAADLIERLRLAASSPPETVVNEWLKGFSIGSLKAGEDEAASVRMSVMEMTGGYLRRNAQAGGGWNMAQVQGIAELLTDHSSELCFAIVSNIARLEPERGASVVQAVRYVAAHGEGLQRKDALRVLALNVLASQSVDTSRRLLREGILIPARAASDRNCESQPPFDTASVATLDAALLDEFSRIQPWLPKVMSASQPEPTEKEKSDALESVLFKSLEGGPMTRALWTSRGCLRKLGCALFAFAMLFLIASGSLKAVRWLWNFIKIHATNSETRSAWTIIVLIVLGIGFFGAIALSKQARLLRGRACAGCGRAARKMDQPSWLRGGVVLSGVAMRLGNEGAGRECARCGRLYCSNCEDATMHCVCGYHPLQMVRLSYRR